MDQDLTIGLKLLSVSRAIEKRVDLGLGEYHGISFRDLELMIVLLNAPDYRLELSALSMKLGIQPSEALRQIVPLERIGVIERIKDVGNARSTKAVLTDVGTVLVKDAMVTASEGVVDAFESRWSMEQQSQLHELLGEAPNIE